MQPTCASASSPSSPPMQHLQACSLPMQPTCASAYSPPMHRLQAHSPLMQPTHAAHQCSPPVQAHTAYLWKRIQPMQPAPVQANATHAAHASMQPTCASESSLRQLTLSALSRRMIFKLAMRAAVAGLLAPPAAAAAPSGPPTPVTPPAASAGGCV
eukprot:scaffold235279_cov17-Tisochrysis_lutea.AAC.1